MTFMPPNVIIKANTARKTMHRVRFKPDILLMAKAPKYKIEVRLTKTYNNNQNTDMIMATCPL